MPILKCCVAWGMNIEALKSFDREHIWHPYASMRNPSEVYVVDRAEGVYLHFADGRKVIDGMSSWWSVAHGYNHPKINEAVRRQLEKMSHVMFGGLTHEGAVELAAKLLSVAPKGLDKVFYSDSGSVSVEVAMKMALQYCEAKGVASKRKFATVLGGYHGDTWHAMSVCDPVSGMHGLFAGGLPINFFAPRPEIPFSGEWNYSDFAPMNNLLERHSSEIAAVILEPIVQGAGGMRFYHPQYLRELSEACRRHSVLLILDEIATGFGRSGKFFASQYAGISPDIMCIGKALTGGYMSFAATLATSEVSDAISDGGAGLFMHGPTFMANPLACAAANASVDLFLESDLLANVSRISKGLEEGLRGLSGVSGVREVRVLGAIGVVEMEKNIDIALMQKRLISRGVWLRPFGRLLYTMPPYIIDDVQLKTLTDAICGSVRDE